jgi:ribosomal protein L24E
MMSMSKKQRAEDYSKPCGYCGTPVSAGGYGGFGKDGKCHMFCSPECRSEYIQKGPKPLQVKLTMFVEQVLQ